MSYISVFLDVRTDINLNFTFSSLKNEKLEPGHLKNACFRCDENVLEKVYVKNSIFHVQSIYFTCLCSLPEMSPRGRFLAGLINISQV